ncbi:MAG: VWA domain-containing protein, partial [Pirellulales bacterium]|nr:VWA domain-containing protein [Pirellulales bacterium]
MTIFAQSTQVSHEFARVLVMSEWWHWLLMLGVILGVLAYTVTMYVRDSVELPRGISTTLMLLRLLAFTAILFYFLGLEKRSARRLVRPSRALLLVDTSQSMGLPAATATGKITRIESVIQELKTGSFVKQLRDQHEVVVYRFDEGKQPVKVAAFPRQQTLQTDSTSAAVGETPLRMARYLAWTGCVLVGLAFVAGTWHFMIERRRLTPDATYWSLLLATVAVIAGLLFFSVANLRHPDAPATALLGLSPTPPPKNTQTTPSDERVPVSIDWNKELIPQGNETRLGDALRFLVQRERGGPIAGIVVFTDGRGNAGQDTELAVVEARNARIPIFAIGLGSNQQPVNVRVINIEAPQRVYPGDDFTISGYIQSFGFAQRQVTVELRAGASAAENAENRSQLIEQQTIRLGSDGEVRTVEFSLEPNAQGKQEYTLRVLAPNQDAEPKDNQLAAIVEIVKRKHRVLLIAGGPAREYRFLRNMLYRDPEIHLEVWLQSAQGDAAQEADDVLFEFPDKEDHLFNFDCIVAFDPNWELLDERDVEQLDRFVADKAGGLIVVSGPVYTAEWTRYRRGRDRRIDTIKSLYPVQFYTQGSASLNLGRVGGEQPWPLSFSVEGLQAEFLWLEDNAKLSEQTWASFEGVYGYYRVKDPKPGAQVFARFSDPDTAIDGQLPIYLAGHFYGAGRVFFQASGEMWRVRSVDDSYFDTYSPRLLRWASAGRMLRDSNRGLLLTDKDRCRIGDHVMVRAILQDAQHQPLVADQVTALLHLPDASQKTLSLRQVQDASQEGTFAAQFTALQSGSYRVDLEPAGSNAGELMSREVRVVAAQTETERPERNDPGLSLIAEQTGGKY